MVTITQSVGCLTTFLIISILCPHANADTNLVPCEGLEAREFPSIDQAVTALSYCYHTASVEENREYIAAIFESANIYQVAAQPGSRGGDEVTLRVRRREDQTLVALWHTHGAEGFARAYFSRMDAKVSRQLGLPFFLTDPGGVIRRLDPGMKKDQAPKIVPGSLRRIPRGSLSGLIVGQI